MVSSDQFSELGSVLKCVRCGTCRSVCPVFEESGWESKTARGRMLLAQGLIRGELEPDPEMIESLSMCTTCGICEQKCPAGATPPRVVQSARQQLVQKGNATRAQLQMYTRAAETGNPLGETANRMQWIGEEPEEQSKSDYVYFVGCLGSYRYPDLARKTFRILEKLEVALLEDEKCCGSPIMRTGFDAGELVSHNLDQIRKSGAHTVITSCAGCYNTLKKDYPDEFNVMHVSEFLAEHIDELGLKRLDLTVTFHDSCHLGRSHGVYDAPRRIIEAICDLKEMKSIRENARCCGGGGGVRTGYPELSMKLSKKRLAEVPDDVDYIVTACHLCRNNLIEGGSEHEVIDLVDLVCLAID
ncbi:CoB--CoM heterodisulfide reductase [Methanosalsum zhilinae DSM 4017]|uniref:CoB--CoM heterodisulfide reductase n=1 Tax=Methanosalsum zhilinae (strain DSM 4017 / NBRC 107636 / OCM 62 / WeN5) TaxID=679901 RepID=F7XMI9_METZD|nr:(Fe-S)-binding protein [Methanosalsum zhilinae]AEH59912.1 CoB--CoM heterodisulfide reductase [Methanosalsum zhilinae DSM 4017]